MKKSLVFLSLVFVVSFGSWYYLTGGTIGMDAAKKAAIGAIAGNTSPEDVAVFALKALEMKQGENGVELWRLKAEWGNMKRSADTIELVTPRFVYYISPNSNEVTITSDKGEIEQKMQIIRFVDNVTSTFDERTLTAKYMVYEGKAKVATFPNGATLTGTNVAGKAEHVVWRLDNKIIEATGGVDVIFQTDRDLLFMPPQPVQQPKADSPQVRNVDSSATARSDV